MTDVIRELFRKRRYRIYCKAPFAPILAEANALCYWERRFTIHSPLQGNAAGQGLLYVIPPEKQYTRSRLYTL